MPREDALAAIIELLVQRHGLAAVYEEVRKRPGFCKNCGVPLEKGRHHLHWGLGTCELVRDGTTS